MAKMAGKRRWILPLPQSTIWPSLQPGGLGSFPLVARLGATNTKPARVLGSGPLHGSTRNSRHARCARSGMLLVWRRPLFPSEAGPSSGAQTPRFERADCGHQACGAWRAHHSRARWPHKEESRAAVASVFSPAARPAALSAGGARCSATAGTAPAAEQPELRVCPWCQQHWGRGSGAGQVALGWLRSGGDPAPRG